MEDDQAIELILGNSNKRFSGVTSTMLQVLHHQQDTCKLAVLGEHHLPPNTKVLSFWQFVKLCRNPASDGKPRVFHARRNDEMIQALLAKTLFGAKLKVAFTSTAQRHHSKFTKWLISKMDSIITTCSAAASYLEKPADIVIPHGIDITRYSPAVDRTQAWQKTGLPGTRGIGIFGRIRPSKGIDTFVDAVIPLLQNDHQLTAIICGETTSKFQAYQEDLQEKIKTAGLTDQLLFIGKHPFDRLPELFQAVSITVAASRNEGFGLTVLESMASGTPVVATEAGAWTDIITDGMHGYCVATEDATDMHDKLALLLEQDIDQLGTQARAHIEENYTTEREASALSKHLLSLRDQ